MNTLLKKVIAGAIGGLLGAVMVDLDAWRKSGSLDFDFKLALKRWIAGTISGGLSGLGMSQVDL